MLLMHKDICVLEAGDNGIRVFEPGLLPFVLKNIVVTYTELYGDFLSYRTLSISRTYAKELLNGLKLSQMNPVKICLANHSVSFADCYWTKEREENLIWRDVSPFQNQIDRSIAKTAFSGSNLLERKHQLHTPELSTHGVSAKCWNEFAGDTYIYKVAKKEVAASEILAVLGVRHLEYQRVSGEELSMIADDKRIEKITEEGEWCVKSGLLTSEKTGMLSFEEFSVFCENKGVNPYEILVEKYQKDYYQMIVVDYILGNDDRHGANWGFWFDNDTQEILELYPLMDHDHAFSEKEVWMTQTLEQDMPMKEAAIVAQEYVKLPVEKLFAMEKPEALLEKEWDEVLERANVLLKNK